MAGLIETEEPVTEPRAMRVAICTPDTGRGCNAPAGALSVQTREALREAVAPPCRAGLLSRQLRQEHLPEAPLRRGEREDQEDLRERQLREAPPKRPEGVLQEHEAAGGAEGLGCPRRSERGAERADLTNRKS